ncbi:MAG: hypothetical protein VX498_01725 [Myxococcota bacterium]|nr:hypothetical protein [Myxococcota bacterium]
MSKYSHLLWLLAILVPSLGLLVLPGCPGSTGFQATWEGQSPGECSDGADNDGDGAYDCDDSDCVGSPDCLGTDDDDAAPDDDDAAPDDDDAAPDDDDSGGQGGGGAEIVGDITRTAECAGDCLGSLYVTLMEGQPGPGSPPVIVAATEILDADLSAAGASVSFQLGGIESRPEGFYLTAFLDDDSSGAEKGPTSGDLEAPPGEVLIDSDTVFEIDLVLSDQLP